ncbi:MarR family winged helix-turn-helix transcriptional regulator [Clostridium sp. 'White wine YQ']|uniref:MarR family winged helix-turn-helix transcriptional regulator n=1 Tax=Clostridium sp. 'White wine YQ' TaxID=3027474 RepID=UPI002365B82D|nr:MarR family transcriptional regulator [Clostridium sp. 'White wine YQ']MDD7795388.1 MarR family transcriptional regulator [Clostridium sp. 'White wine YQ']
MKELDCKVLRFTGTLYRAINSKADFEYKKYDLQKGQYMFLTRVCENPGINFVELSNMLKVDKATTTKAVKKLIDIGYMNKQQGQSDKREYKLTPTKKGLEVYNFILGEERKQLEISFKGFSKDEKQLATELIRRMSENIEEYWAK